MSYSSSSERMMGHQDSCYYVNGESGMLKVTGVGWLIRDGDTHSSICVENRVALTKAEQGEIGDKQPFMLNNYTRDNEGNIFTNVYLAKVYLDKMTSKGKEVKLTKEADNEMSVLMQIVEDAQKRKKEFQDRHFLMALLREGIKDGEDPMDALERGIREECKQCFREGIGSIQHKFVYERRGNTCLLVYFVDADMLVDDNYAISKAGQCNYFCAKSLPGVIDNDYLETRQHEMLPNEEIERRLIDFEMRFGKNGMGCDLKYWGGLDMWQECKKYF